MSNPLGPAEKKQIERLDHQLGGLIEEVHSGKEDMGSFFHIAQQLSALCLSKHVPDAVKERLQAALQELQDDPSLNLSHLIQAKQEIDSVINNKESDEESQL